MEMERDIERDEAICSAATKEPWRARQIVSTAGPMQMPVANGWEILGMTEDGTPLADWFERKEDAVFAEVAREALPWYIGEVKRLRIRILRYKAEALCADNEQLSKALDLACRDIAADECGECPCVDQDRDAAFWIRYYMEKALEVRNG